MSKTERLECFGTANFSDACCQCPDNEECVKETYRREKEKRGDVMSESHVEKVNRIIERMRISLRGYGALTPLQIEDILCIVSQILAEEI